MNCSLRQLRLLLALDETGSVSAAARKLFITQPTASQQLQEMARQIGLPVHEVIGRRARLTEAGLALRDAARQINDAWEVLDQRLSALKGLETGKLRVAVVSTAKYFMPRLIGSFCQQHPGIDLSLEILNRDGVVTRLRDNRDDLYIMSMPPDDLPLTDAPFMPNPIEVIGARAQWSETGPMSLATLASQRMILREPGSGTRMAVDQHFAAAGLKPLIRLEMGSNEAIKESVAANLGVGIVSRSALQSPGSLDMLSILAVDGFPLPATWHIVHPARKSLSPVAAAFKQHLLVAAAQSKAT